MDSDRTAPTLALLALLAFPLTAAAQETAAPERGQEAAQAQEAPEISGPAPEWQQEVHYTIEARLDEEEQVLEGAAVLAYHNASPDTLDRVYLHLHLNAFRPHSLWARTEGREQYDFTEIEEPDYAFERLRSVRVGDAEATPAYPHAPDSTVVELPLPEPLAPGDTAVLHLRWDARPATLCRRQCRQGRHWDMAQWYPRVAVYDQEGWRPQPLLPQGEFYGEYGTYDVTLDLAEDQVVGATGVPIEGDPGWAPPAEGSPRDEPHYQRGWYGEPGRTAGPVGFLQGAPEPGRKRVRFYAEDVHHFGWSANPEYIYEGGVYEPDASEAAAGGDGAGGGGADAPREVAVHVLYRPGDTTWAGGTAVERTVRALEWLGTIFRPYPWPQLTNVHRLESGGTEFPMLIMDGSASQGLITHETTHQYAHGILGNNEWRDAWLDEGLTSFLDGWFAEEHGQAQWEAMLTGLGQLEALLTRRPPADELPEQMRGMLIEGDTLPEARPVAIPSEEFASYAQYGAMSYSKPAAVFYMLRELVGADTMRDILRAYYDRHAFGHVTEADFRRVAEDVSGRDLDGFFDQWLHTTATLDYALGDVTTRELPDGGWETRVEVVREGEAWMPVTLRVGEETRRLESRDRRQAVEVRTEARPEVVVLDPETALLDVDRTNQRWSPEDG